MPGGSSRFVNRRRGLAVALGAEVHLGGVDLDESDTLAIAERDRVTVRYVVDPVDARL